jgi:hypothetical protein
MIVEEKKMGDRLGNSSRKALSSPTEHVTAL